MVEYIVVSFATMGAWFKDLMPSTDQVLDYWPYLLGVAGFLVVIFLLVNRK